MLQSHLEDKVAPIDSWPKLGFLWLGMPRIAPQLDSQGKMLNLELENFKDKGDKHKKTVRSISVQWYSMPSLDIFLYFNSS